MASNEEKKDPVLSGEGDRQIRLVVDQSSSDEVTIDLGNVFRNMKLKKRVFAWVLVLCLTVGICAPLLMYQFTKTPLTVSSVVTLQYEIPSQNRQVQDLTAPDGTALDLNQITSTYVLQTALDRIPLSKPITVSTLRPNLSIRTILTEESQRTKEMLAGLAEAKNAEAYTRLEEAEITYQNRFQVSLTNGFGEEDSQTKLELTDNELKLLLNQILTVYNEYLVKTYADVRLPEDVFSVIDTAELDILDSLDLLQAGIKSLHAYSEEKTDAVREYRSWKTGRSLNDWMETLDTFRSINVDYLYTLVSENAITRDKAALLTSYKYLLRNAQNDLQKTNEEIEETQKILKNYKNDEIYVAMQESDAARTTKAATGYYNQLVLQQTKNYTKATELKISAADYAERIARLEATTETEVTEDVEQELAHSLSGAQSLYDQIREHMEELFESPLYTTYSRHSMPQGKQPNFLAASAKKIIIGAVAGVIIACGLWFLAGLAAEFSKSSKEQETGKEAAGK